MIAGVATEFNIFIYIHIHTHTYIYKKEIYIRAYICMCVYVYIKYMNKTNLVNLTIFSEDSFKVLIL